MLDNDEHHVVGFFACQYAQDPVFKRFFYQEVLPELRAMGKAVLVISHDDRYFNVADRIIHLDTGKVRSVDVSHLRGVRRLQAGRGTVLPMSGGLAN